MSASDLWQSKAVQAALKERTPDNIYVLDCPRCGAAGYYNQGSHFTCRFCEQTWYCCSEDEEPPTDRQYMFVQDSVRTLADTVDTGEEGP